MRTLTRKGALGLTAGALAIAGLASPALAAGDSSAVDRAGSVVPWGSGTLASTVPDLGDSVVAVAASNGANYDIALKADGTLAAWGDAAPANLPDELEDPATAHVVQVSAGPAYALALRSDGSVLAWGPAAPAADSQPALSDVVQVLAAPTGPLALSKDGDVTAWGGAMAPTSEVADADVVQIASETAGFLALTADGHIIPWGVLPDTNIPDEIQGHVETIAAGGFSAAAILDDDSVSVWGAMGAKPRPTGLDDETADQLDLNGSVIVHTTEGHVFEWGGDASTAAANVPAELTGAPVAQVVSGYTKHDLAIVTALRGTAAPVITGTPTVGATLHLTPATFNLPTGDVTTEWKLSDGTVVGDGDSLKVTAAMIGKTITVSQTATAETGDDTATATSEPTAAVAKLASALTATATGGVYGSTPTTVSVSLAPAAAGAVTIKDGATTVGTGTLAAGKATITLGATAVPAGTHALTASWPGDADHAATTKAVSVTIAKATATATVKLKPKKLAKHKSVTKHQLAKGKAKVNVTAAGFTPTGTVTVKLGKKKVTGTLVNGKVTIKLKKLAKKAKKGKNKLKVTYNGDTNTNPDGSKTTLKLK